MKNILFVLSIVVSLNANTQTRHDSVSSVTEFSDKNFGAFTESVYYDGVILETDASLTVITVSNGIYITLKAFGAEVVLKGTTCKVIRGKKTNEEYVTYGLVNDDEVVGYVMFFNDYVSFSAEDFKLMLLDVTYVF